MASQEPNAGASSLSDSIARVSLQNLISERVLQSSSMDSYRHNGHALVFGHNADISRDSFCDKDTTLEGDCSVHGQSKIYNSALRDAKLFQVRSRNAVFSDSVVVASHLTDTIIEKSYVSSAWLTDARLQECDIRSYLSSGETAYITIRKVFLRDVVIDGAVSLFGPWTLDGPYYIREGQWSRAPRAFILDGENGVRVGITEGWGETLCIGQRVHPMAQWLKAGPRLAQRIGWTEDQVNRVRLFIEELRDVRIAA